MKNQVQLITYTERFGNASKGLAVAHLQALLAKHFASVIGGVHLLPFYESIHGSDAGFDPTDHLSVDQTLGSWDDVRALGREVALMADVIVNHVSSRSPEFLDFSRQGSVSPFAALFLTQSRVFGDTPNPADLDKIYRPRPTPAFTPKQLENGETKLLWTTFTSEQIDIDIESPPGRAYLSRILQTLSASGVTMARLDAVGYAIKRAGTNCFMLPETFSFIESFSQEAKSLGIEVLVEVHSHYQTQIDIAAKVDWVYDFALPPLLLHALHFGTAQPLAHWLDVRPSNAVTVLDTHDGIGIIDIGADRADRTGKPGLVPDNELDALVESIHNNCAGQSRLATGAAASNLDLYQVNCTYFDALGADEEAYLIARAVQFFMPGIPQVYYVGLLAGRNDMDLLAKTGVGRDINRHYYSDAEIASTVQAPVVVRLLSLIQLRNTHPAFSGQFSFAQDPANVATLQLLWRAGDAFAQLTVDFANRTASLNSSSRDGSSEYVRYG